MVHFLVLSFYRNFFRSFVYFFNNLLCRRVNKHFDVHFDGFDPSFFCRMMEKTLSMREEMDKKMFISRQICNFSFVNDMIEIFFPICTSNWHVNNYVSRQEKGVKRRKKLHLLLYKLQTLVLQKDFCFFFNSFYWWKLFPSERGDCISLKTSSVNKNLKKNLNSVFKTVELFPLPHYGHTKERAKVNSCLERYARKY